MLIVARPVIGRSILLAASALLAGSTLASAAPASPPPSPRAETLTEAVLALLFTPDRQTPLQDGSAPPVRHCCCPAQCAGLE